MPENAQKFQQKNFLWLHYIATPWKKLPVARMLFRNYSTGNKPNRRSITATTR